jgi:hypothetical protein
MKTDSRDRHSGRLLRVAAVTAALMAIGATATDATAGTAPAVPRVPANAVPTTSPLPTIGARKTPFGARSATSGSAGAADISATPWVVGIQTQYPLDVEAGNGWWVNEFCTGTVVSPVKVLVQAGCDGVGDQSHSVVIAGRNDLLDNSSGFVAGVASTWQGPMNAAGNNGLEVLTLQQPLPSAYPPISMTAPGDDAPYLAGTSATLVGYGLQAATSGAGKTVLSQSAMTVQDSSACSGQDGFDLTQDVCVTPNTPFPAGSTAGTGQALVSGNTLAGVALVVGSGTVKSQLAYAKLSAFNDAITTDLGRPSPGNEDWNGDGRADLFGVDGAGHLIDYEGSGLAQQGGLADQLPIDWGNWSGETLLRATDWNGDGRENVLEVDPEGNLFEDYPNNSGNGGLGGGRQQVGSGFNQFIRIIPTNNWTGDGHPDLIAERADGSLWLYERSSNGWINGNGVEIGSGFNEFTGLVPFQWTDDGHTGLLGVTGQGNLEFYATDGAGHWTTGSGELIGVGFGGLRTVVGPGSWGGTDTGVVMTVDGSGNLMAYQADGTGGWLTGNGIQVGVGFQTLKALF